MDILPRIPDGFHLDLAGSPLPTHHNGFGILPAQNRLGMGATVGVQIIRRQAARGKAGTAARLPHQQNAVGDPPAAQRRL